MLAIRYPVMYAASEMQPTFKHVKSLMLHSLMVRSPEAVANTWSAGLNLTLQTPRLCPLKMPSGTIFASGAARALVGAEYSIANSLAVRSCEPVARSLSFGEMSSELISLSCTLSVASAFAFTGTLPTASPETDWSDAISQILTVLSCEAVAAYLPSRRAIVTAPMLPR